jgi:hypothetical protein
MMRLACLHHGMDGAFWQDRSARILRVGFLVWLTNNAGSLCAGLHGFCGGV